MRIPSRACLEAALRLATERFAAELARPSGQTPVWSDFQWTMARAAAVMHGVTPLLATVTDWRESQRWAQFATEQQQHTALRRQRLVEGLALIDQESRRAALPIMALKGSALHALGLYLDGQRPMADIDLLVAPKDANRLCKILEALGFQEQSTSHRHRVFTHAGTARCDELPDPPYGERAGAALKVEVHRHIAERFPASEVDITNRLWPIDRHPGVNSYSSPLALMLHLLLHAAGSMSALGLRLIQLHDIALLAQKMRPTDWAALLEQRVDERPPWWALPPLELMTCYYPDHVPTDVLVALRALCPGGLRRRAARLTLSEVSYSTLKLQPFPALPWAPTLWDKIVYLRSRIRPSPETLQLRVVGGREEWAAGNPWLRLSHGWQMVHWLLARPLRPLSVFNVRAAMADQAARAGHLPPSAGVRSDLSRTR